MPGAGKTCYSMDFLLQAQEQTRPLFTHGIPELKIPHTDVFCDAISCEYCIKNKPISGEVLLAESWDVWAPDGAYLVFDEVQHIYRPRRQGSEPPSSVKAFETHRHRGLDFLLMSQNPMLFDTNVRKLVSRHIHLRPTWAGRTQFEWPECADNPKLVSNAVKSNYQLQKKNFALYKSAEIHTKQPRKIPNAVYLLVACVVGVGFLGVKTYGNMRDKTNAELLTELQAPEPVTGSASVGPDRGSAGDPFDRAPELELYPESASAFAHLVEVKDFPRVAGCIASPDGSCQCYTQQATKLKLDKYQCLEFVENTPFNPYYEPDDGFQKGFESLNQQSGTNSGLSRADVRNPLRIPTGKDAKQPLPWYPD